MRRTMSSMTCRASSWRPRLIRYNGDSGTPRRTQKTRNAGSTITARISRQLSVEAWIRAETKNASAAPTGHQPSIAVSTRPRCRVGVNSPTSA